MVIKIMWIILSSFISLMYPFCLQIHILKQLPSAFNLKKTRLLAEYFVLFSLFWYIHKYSQLTQPKWNLSCKSPWISNNFDPSISNAPAIKFYQKIQTFTLLFPLLLKQAFGLCEGIQHGFNWNYTHYSNSHLIIIH